MRTAFLLLYEYYADHWLLPPGLRLAPSHLSIKVGAPHEELLISPSRGEVVAVAREGGRGHGPPVSVEGVVGPALEKVIHAQSAVVRGREQEVARRVE